ncbi:MAG: hypothetical protein R6X02_20220 [Enhygromyxa sp.]
MRSFLTSEDEALLEVLVSEELEPQAARLVDGVANERGDLVIPVMVEWTSAEALSQAIIVEVQGAIEAAAAALAKVQEVPRFSWPTLSASPRVPIHVKAVELAESLARASSNHIDRVVVAMAISGPESKRPEIAAAVWALVQSTGTPDLKWMLFGRAALLGEREVPHRRHQPCPTEPSAASRAFADFCQDPSARVLSVGGPASSGGWLRHLTAPDRLGTSRMLAVHIEGITYLEHRFYFTEVSRSLTHQCRELEATTTGGNHVGPLYDEVHALTLHNNAELHFAELCERLAASMLVDDCGLLVVLAPDRTQPILGLEESVLTLARSATSSRVRYVIDDPRLSPSFGRSQAWGIRTAEYAISVQEIEQGMRERLEARDCSVVEKLRYLTALAGAALARDDPETAQALSLEALELSKQADDPREVTVAWYGLGNTLHQSGTFAAAEQAYAECVDRALDEGDDNMTAQGMLGLANTFFMRQGWAQAIDCYETAAKLLDKLGQVHGHAYALMWSAEAHVLLGRYQEALQRFDRALAAIDGVNPALAREYSGQRAELLMRKAKLYARAGMTVEQSQLEIEARRLGASEHLIDHP